MGFQWEPAEQRVRINLSEHALLIIEEDMFEFGVAERSGFVNTVFQNFHEKARSSYNQYLKNYKNELIRKSVDSYPNLKRTGTDLTKINIESLVAYERYSVDNYIQGIRKRKNKGISYRINNRNSDYLRSEKCEENTYYHSVSGYLKCVLEEYCDLPFLKREEIYFADRYKIVREAIEDHYGLKLSYPDGNIVTVYPYSLEPDQLSTRLYLTGCYMKEDQKHPGQFQLHPASYRIPMHPSIEKTEQKYALTHYEIKQLEKAIHDCSVMFLLGDAENIHVHLTDNGIKKYNHILHMRPPKDPDLSNTHTYVFHCTPLQAEYYFTRFGGDAVILEPTYLRERVRNYYAEALDKYNFTE